jgi:DNA repair exonuclease SbcCD ATPase subunit
MLSSEQLSAAARHRVIRLKSLNLRAFRSYIEETIDFPATGMMLLKGSNLDTKGGSGSGKSTIIEGLNFGLDFATFPSTELQSWLTDKPLQVTLELDTPRGDVCITRGDKPKFSAEGQKTLTGATAAATALDRALEINPKLLRALTCRSQRKAGMFLSLTDSEKKEFLTPILGVEPFEKAADDAGRRVLELQKQVQAATASWEATRNQGQDQGPTYQVLRQELTQALEQLSDAIAEAWQNVQDIQADEDQWKLDQRQTRLQETQRIADQIEALDATPVSPELQVELDDLNLHQAEAQRRIAAAKETEARAEQERRALIKTKTQELEELRQQQQWLATATAEINRCKAELEHVAASVCPTCKQSWVGKGRAAMHGDLHDTIEDYKYEIVEHMGIHPLIDEEIAALKKELETLAVSTDTSTSRKLELARTNILARIQALKNKINTRNLEAIANLKNQLPTLQELASPFTDRWKKALDIHSSLEVKFITKKLELGGVEARLQEVLRLQDREALALVTLKELETILHREQDFQDMVKDFLAAVFDEALAEISDETNHILSGVPNTANVTLQFRSETMSQKGTAKKSIVPVMTIGGHEAKLSSGCSGGMISSVELATDLAVRSVVSRRLGVRPGWIILDEPFEGLGPVEKEGYLEIIREYARDNLVIVVDHSSEFKEFFTQIVEIEYSNGISKVVKVSHDN